MSHFQPCKRIEEEGRLPGTKQGSSCSLSTTSALSGSTSSSTSPYSPVGVSTMSNPLCQDSTTLYSPTPSTSFSSSTSPTPEVSWSSFAFSEAELRELRSALVQDLGRDAGWNDADIREMAITTLEFVHVLSSISTAQRERKEEREHREEVRFQSEERTNRKHEHAEIQNITQPRIIRNEIQDVVQSANQTSAQI